MVDVELYIPELSTAAVLMSTYQMTKCLLVIRIVVGVFKYS